MSQQFKQWETLDAVSCLEQNDDHPLFAEIANQRDAIEQELRDSSRSFQEKTLVRAKQLSQATSIAKNLQEVNAKINLARWIVIAIMLFLGGFAVVNVFDDTLERVNIFWLIIVLLGVNTLSILFYLATLFKKKTDLRSIPSFLFKSLLNLSNKQFSKNITGKNALIKSWSTMNLTGAVGRWSFSRYLHGAWLAYLLGALATLMLILLAKQIDFVWGTTLLNGDFFIQLTSGMSHLQSSLGLPTLSTQQILSSRVNSASNLSASTLDLAQNRQRWAYFLIISLLLYGIFPRFLLWGYSVLKQRHAKKTYQPEWNTPYFVQLRERMIPSASVAVIVDADSQNPPKYSKNTFKKERLKTEQQQPSSSNQRISLFELRQRLQSEPIIVAYEWFPRHPWPVIDLTNDWGIVSNREQQQNIVQKLQQIKGHDLAICISSEHVADRGALRFFSTLNEYTELYLFVFEFAAQKQLKRRWAEWLHLTDQLKLNQERVVLIDAKHPDKTASN